MQPVPVQRVQLVRDCVLCCALVLLTLSLSACRPISAAHADPAAPAGELISADWPTFTYPDWGVSLHYPPGWQVETGPWGVALMPPRADGMPTGGGVIVMEPYTISPSYDLADWVQWRSRDGEHPSIHNMIVAFAPTAQMPFAAIGDQVVYAIQDSPLLHRETVWVAQDGLVFRIDGFAAPEYRYPLAEVAASLTFDRATLTALAAGGTLAGDETAMQARIADHAAPYAAVTQAAVQNSRTLPPAQSTPPLERYTGHNPYGPDYPDFTVEYDPTLWTLTPADEQSSWDWLHSQQMEDCALALSGGSTEVLDSRWRWIGGQWWVEAQVSDEIVDYSLHYADTYYIFSLAAPKVDPTNARQPCQRMAEQVLSTFAIVEP